MLEHGYDSKTRRETLSRMNRIHRRFPIPNEDYDAFERFNVEYERRHFRFTALPPRRRPRLRTQQRHRSYPRGYRLDELGPPPA